MEKFENWVIGTVLLKVFTFCSPTLIIQHLEVALRDRDGLEVVWLERPELVLSPGIIQFF